MEGRLAVMTSVTSCMSVMVILSTVEVTTGDTMDEGVGFVDTVGSKLSRDN